MRRAEAIDDEADGTAFILCPVRAVIRRRASRTIQCAKKRGGVFGCVIMRDDNAAMSDVAGVKYLLSLSDGGEVKLCRGNIGKAAHQANSGAAAHWRPSWPLYPL